MYEGLLNVKERLSVRWARLEVVGMCLGRDRVILLDSTRGAWVAR